MTAQRAPTISRHKNATKSGQILHLDLHFLETETEEGDKYYTIVVDAFSRMLFIFFHKDKSDLTVVSILDNLLIKLRQTPPKVLRLQEICSDNAEESGKQWKLGAENTTMHTLSALRTILIRTDLPNLQGFSLWTRAVHSSKKQKSQTNIFITV